MIPKYLQVGNRVGVRMGLKTWMEGTVLQRNASDVAIDISGRRVTIHCSVIRRQVRKCARPSTGPARRAQLVADAVSVLCPYCGEPHPNPSDGSEQWTKSDFLKLASSIRDCVSCEKPFMVSSDPKVQFL